MFSSGTQNERPIFSIFFKLISRSSWYYRSGRPVFNQLLRAASGARWDNSTNFCRVYTVQAGLSIVLDSVSRGFSVSCFEKRAWLKSVATRRAVKTVSTKSGDKDARNKKEGRFRLELSKSFREEGRRGRRESSEMWEHNRSWGIMSLRRGLRKKGEREDWSEDVWLRSRSRGVEGRESKIGKMAWRTGRGTRRLDLREGHIIIYVFCPSTK